jgi:hypothetical protein
LNIKTNYIKRKQDLNINILIILKVFVLGLFYFYKNYIIKNILENNKRLINIILEFI